MTLGDPFPQSTIAPHSDFAWAIYHLYADIFWWALGVFVLVAGLLLYVVIRYRQRPGEVPSPARRGHTALEIAWTLAPAVVLACIAVPTIRTIFATDGADPPRSALRVAVVGHQWWWEYKYPDLGIVTANELHVPVGRPVQLAITSADVIHSFWDPELGGKRDAIPGHMNHILFRADSTGVYRGQCAEFCGASHANMRLRVFVDSDSVFRAWVKTQQGAPAALVKATLAERGKAVFSRSVCIGCHTIQGVSRGLIGPNLTHVASRSTIAGGIFPEDSAHLASWIANAPSLKPGAVMTRMKPPLTDADIAALVAYLQSLK